MIKSSLQNQQQQTPSTSMSEQNMSNNIKKVLFPLQNSDGSKGKTNKYVYNYIKIFFIFIVL